MIRITVKFLVFILIIFILSENGLSKPTSWSKSGMQGTKSLGEFDNINPFNGRLNFTMPLLNITGRGESSINVPLTIENTLWRYYVHYEPHWVDYAGSGPSWDCSSKVTFAYTTVTIDGQTEGGYETSTKDYCSQSSGTGPLRIPLEPYQFHHIFAQNKGNIDPGYGPGVIYGTYESRYQFSSSTSYNGPPTNVPNAGIGRTTLTFVMPDGSTQEFFDTKTMGRFKSYSIINGQAVYFSREKNFTTIDGSSTTFISDNPITDNENTSSYPVYYSDPNQMNRYFSPSGFILSKNGSKYRVEDGLIKWKIDVNGNKTSYTYTTPANPAEPRKISQIKDSLGRTVTFLYNVDDNTTAPDGTPYGLRDEINYLSINGTNQKIIITKTDLGNSLRSGFALKKYNELWSVGNSSSANNLFTKQVISSVWTADGTVIKFRYDSYGNLARAVYPSGRAVEYDYDAGNIGQNYQASFMRRRLSEKRLYNDSNDSNSLVNKINFSDVYAPRISGDSSPVSTQPVQVDIKDKNDTLLARTKHYFIGDPLNISQTNRFSRTHGLETDFVGKEIKKEVINPISQQVFERTEYLWQYRVPGSRPYYTGAPPSPQNTFQDLDQEIPGIDPVLAETKVTIEPYKNGGLVKKETIVNPANGNLSIDSNNNFTDIWAYNYGVGGSLSLAATHEHIDYLSVNPVNGVNYSAPSNGLNYAATDLHIRNLQSSRKQYSINQTSGVETEISRKNYLYDEPSYPIQNQGTVSEWVDPQHTYRGNVTTVQTWYAEQNQWLNEHFQYDQYGNLRKAWDISGDPNRFTETEYSANYQYAYPTKVITPAPSDGVHGTSQGSWSEATYDFNTGLPLTTKNEFEQITATEYDSYLRPIRVYGQNYATPETQTIYGLPDASGQIPSNQRFVKVRKQIDEANWDEAITWFDGLGRTVLTTATDSQGDISTQTKYDALGRVEMVTTPYRQNDPIYWTKTRYDELGRAVETFAPTTDPVNNPGTSNGLTSFDISTLSGYVGTVVTNKDASGRKSRSITNALGQLLRVDEPSATGGTADADLGTLVSPNQPTFYKYDERGNLKEVNQGGQIRNFTYDSFSRIKSASNPESGTVNYTYDIFGNLKTKRDARGIKTIYDYDKFHRIIKRCYRVIGTGATSLGAANCAEAESETVEPNTPDVSYFYDGKGLPSEQSPNYAKGKLTKVSSSASETLYTNFDSLGRLTNHQQITDGQTYSTSYKYNFNGSLAEEIYPSGKVVRNFYESDGDLASVIRNGKTYASNFSYTAAGAIEKIRLGNGNWESTQFNNRLQAVQFGLGNAATNTTNLWKVNYEYGELQSDGTTVDSSKNNGNIAKQIITVPTVGNQSGFVATQVYAYDSLNRLKQAKETIASQTNWQQTFSYDRFGNRNFDEHNTTTLPKACLENNLPVVCAADRKSFNPTVNQANNRLSIAEGFEYDANGNVTKDAEGRRFTYDALNKQKLVKNSADQPVGNYIYDGDGKRIKKLGSTENTLFVYDAFGSLIAEYTIENQQSNPTPNTSYLTTDTLGSPRIVTGKNGEVLSRRDFLPFGEEIIANETNRKAVLGYNYGNSLTRQSFTGYEKDTESDLEFAQNRYYSNKFGRFTTVDPLMASGKVRNPQTWNRYIYVTNNPVNRIDPLGLCDRKTDPNCINGTHSIGNFSVDIKINEDWALDISVNETSIHPQIDGKSLYQWLKQKLWDTGTGTPTIPPILDPTLPPPNPGPIEKPPAPNPSDPNAPEPGGGSDSDKVSVPTGFTLEQALAILYVLGRTAYEVWVSQTNADRVALPDNTIVVRGGVAPDFPRFKKRSGAMGNDLTDAGRGVRHNKLWWTTAGQIRAGGGRVWLDPEPAYPAGVDKKGKSYPAGPTNYRHASIILGITQGGFKGPVDNRAPKNERPPAQPK